MFNGNLFDVGDIFVVALPKKGLPDTEHYELWDMLQELFCKCELVACEQVSTDAGAKYLG